MIVPFKYGYKNPKAILRMKFVDTLVYGTWSKIGPYFPDGTILPVTIILWTKTRSVAAAPTVRYLFKYETADEYR